MDAIVASELHGESCTSPEQRWGVWLVALRVALKTFNPYLKLLCIETISFTKESGLRVRLNDLFKARLLTSPHWV